MESDEDNSVCSMTKQCNQERSKIFISHVSDSPKGDDNYRCVVLCFINRFMTTHLTSNPIQIHRSITGLGTAYNELKQTEKICDGVQALKASPQASKKEWKSPKLTRHKSFRRGLSKRSLLSSGRITPSCSPNNPTPKLLYGL